MIGLTLDISIDFAFSPRLRPQIHEASMMRLKSPILRRFIELGLNAINVKTYSERVPTNFSKPNSMTFHDLSILFMTFL